MEKMQYPGLGWAFVAALALTWPRAAAAEPIDTYIALGNSVAFGTGFAQSPTIDVDPSNPASISSGDRGYVALYADFLATRDGGVRPNVINLAVNGESTASFLGTGAGFGPPPPPFSSQFPTQNTNYLGLSPTPTQADLFVSKVASEQAAGHTISTVSIQLGADDFQGYLAAHPEFLTSDPKTQQEVISQILSQAQANYTQILTEVRAKLPSANLLLIGYYDPYPAVRGLLPSPSIADLSGPVVQGLNGVIAGEAAAFKDK